MFNTDINENNQNAVVLQNTKILNGTHDIVNRDKTNYFTYSIQKNETLSKISIKFFGNSKFEDKIYELNKTLLHDKNRIREGIKIKIPVE